MSIAGLTEIADPPRQAVIETVTSCALKCPSCYIGAGLIRRPKQLMEWDLFSKIADQIEPFVTHAYCHLWGEPTMHPRIGDVVRRLREFATVDLSTHGILVTEENVDALCQATSLSVSIDGLDQETYEKYRVRGSLEKAMAGMRLLRDRFKGVVNWTWVVTRENEHQIEDARRLAVELGVNFGAKPPYFISEEVRLQLEPVGEQYQRYNRDGVLKANRQQCPEFWETIYFNPEGEVFTCCYDHSSDWVMGNVHSKTVLEIWNDEPYRAMRRRHLSGQLNTLCETQCGMP